MARSRPAALPQPGRGRVLFYHAQQSVADLRKNMDVLVAVHIIRGTAENRAERGELGGDLGLQSRRVEPAQQSACRHPGKR